MGSCDTLPVLPGSPADRGTGRAALHWLPDWVIGKKWVAPTDTAVPWSSSPSRPPCGSTSFPGPRSTCRSTPPASLV